MSQNIQGVNNYTNVSGTRNTIEDYSVPFRNIFSSEGILNGLEVEPTSPNTPAVNIKVGSCVIDCGGAGFLTFRLKTQINDLVVPNTGGATKYYLVCLKVDLTNATQEFVVMEGTTGLDPTLTEGGDPEIYYLVIARIAKEASANVSTSEIIQDGETTTNNGDNEIIYRYAYVDVDLESALETLGLAGAVDDDVILLRKYENLIFKNNTDDYNSTTMHYFRAGTELYENRIETPYRLTNTGVYQNREYAPLGEVSPNPTHIFGSSITYAMYIDGAPSGVNFAWDNGSGGGTGFWYDVLPGDTIYNITRGNSATVATFAYKTGSVTDAADISTWANNDELVIYSPDLSGKIKAVSGFAPVLDINCKYKYILRGTAITDKLKFQLPGRSWIIRGTKKVGGGTFKIYVDGVLLTASVSTADVSTLRGEDLYTYIPPTSITSNEDYVRKRHIIEIVPNGDGDVDIEYFWVRNTRFSLNFHSMSPQAYSAPLLVLARSIYDNDLYTKALNGVINMIQMNQLTDQSDDDLAWSDYINWGERYTFGNNGVGAFEAATYSTNAVYWVYPGQPTNTASGFVGAYLLCVYLVGKSKMSYAQATLIRNSILGICQYFKLQEYSHYAYTANAALFHILTFLAGYYVRQDIGWTAPATTLSAAISSTVTTTFTVANATDFEIGDIVLIDNEYMAIDNISGNTVTAYRGLIGSTATTHSNGASVVAQDFDVYAKALWYSLINGNATTVTPDPFFKYTKGDGSDELLDEAWGEELPVEDTLANAVAAADLTIDVTDLTSLVALSSVTKDSLEDLDVDDILWQSGNTIRINFNSSPDLSGIVAGDVVNMTGASNSSNNGNFVITAVNDGSDYIEITNDSRSNATDDETSSSAVADIGNYINLDFQLEKPNGTWEIVRANKVNYGATNQLQSVLRAQDGSTTSATIASGKKIKRCLDWSYSSVTCSQLPFIYYFLDKLGFTSEATQVKRMAKACYRLQRRRLDLTMGTIDTVAGSRLSAGGATHNSVIGCLNTFSRMGEGCFGDDLAVLKGKWATDELNAYNYLADAVRLSGSDNANRDLGATQAMLDFMLPLTIKYLEK